MKLRKPWTEELCSLSLSFSLSSCCDVECEVRETKRIEEALFLESVNLGTTPYCSDEWTVSGSFLFLKAHWSRPICHLLLGVEFLRDQVG